MRTVAIFSLLLLPVTLLSSSAFAETRLGDSCDLSILGVRDNTDFMHFDNALREAVQARDAAALSRLVQFPLRLNYQNGSHVAVSNATALQDRLATTWPILHKAVIGQQPGELFCNAEGVMYGDGEIWAGPTGGVAAPFRITSISLPDSAAVAVPAQAKPAEANVQLACNTDRFHIVIDGNGDDASRYRSWNKPHAAPDKPAMELAGKANGEGTGSCFHRIWDFRNGNADYVLSEPGCSEGNVPGNAKAQLEVLVGGKSQLKSWCY
jgi:hypothetical protein